MKHRIVSIYNRNSIGHEDFGVWLWAGKVDDMWFSSPGLREKHNTNRYQRFIINLTFYKWTLTIKIPLKHIGWNLRGKNREPIL